MDELAALLPEGLATPLGVVAVVVGVVVAVKVARLVVRLAMVALIALGVWLAVAG